MAIEERRESPHDSQQLVLADVLRRTGRSFLKIAGIDSSVNTTAQAVLPVLAEWVSLVPEGNIRAAIYSRFSTVHANAYVGQLLQWAKHETHDRGRDALIQAVVKAARSKDAKLIWSEIKGCNLSGFDVMLMAKLTTFPSVAEEVKDYLLAQLGSEEIDFGDLQFIATVDDRRILSWFREQCDSRDSKIRVLASRVVERSKPLPHGLSYAIGVPERSTELFSAEVDIAEVGQIFAELALRFGAKIPTFLRGQSAIWNRAEVDRWMKTEIVLKEKVPADLWLRLEDVDVVEIALTHDRPANTMDTAPTE